MDYSPFQFFSPALEVIDSLRMGPGMGIFYHREGSSKLAPVLHHHEGGKKQLILGYILSDKDWHVVWWDHSSRAVYTLESLSGYLENVDQIYVWDFMLGTSVFVSFPRKLRSGSKKNWVYSLPFCQSFRAGYTV